ncbi:MAG: hypothetical protein M3Y25_04540 [Thermoproteota archaeon]|nr:hypothetical protein [Thermoproteota archaeon]
MNKREKGKITIGCLLKVSNRHLIQNHLSVSKVARIALAFIEFSLHQYVTIRVSGGEETDISQFSKMYVATISLY